MRNIWVAAGMAALLLAGCTQLVTSGLPDRPVDDTYEARFWTWQGGEQLTFAYKAFEHRGKVALCGARAESSGGGHHQRTFNERAVQTLYLTLADDVLVNDISFFREGAYVPDAAPQGSAACVLTDRPWTSFYDDMAPELEAAKTRFKVID